MDAEQQSADDSGAPPAAGRPAADDELLAVHVLELQPAAVAPARAVGAVEAFGEDALETADAARLEHVVQSARELWRRLPMPAVERELAQRGAAFAVALSHQGVAVEPEQVEDHVGDRDGLRQASRGGCRGHVHPPLQLAKAGASARVERDDLAVEHGAA